MTITLANTTDEYYTVNKTYTTVLEITNASIIYPCDVLNPTFKIKGGYVAANAVIDVFGRNYWIAEQTLNEGINYISCTVDAFSSWASDIYGTTQFVERSEKNGNLTINDGLFPLPNTQQTYLYPSNVELVTGDLTYVIGVI